MNAYGANGECSLSAREAARLMGLPDGQLPARYDDAYHLIGHGVVRHLAEHILEPILRGVPLPVLTGRG